MLGSRAHDHEQDHLQAWSGFSIGAVLELSIWLQWWGAACPCPWHIGPDPGLHRLWWHSSVMRYMVLHDTDFFLRGNLACKEKSRAPPLFGGGPQTASHSG